MKSSDLKESTAQYAARSKEGIVNALRDARAARLVVPPSADHAHRFLFGFVVPITLLRIAWSDPATRRSMLRRLTAPVLCLVLATVVSIGSIAQKSDDASDSGNDSADVDDDDDAKAADGKEPAPTADEDKDEDENLSTLPPAARAAIAEGKRAAARGREQARRATHKPPSAPPPTGPLAALRAAFDVLTSRVVKILAALGAVEWILIWIGREHHDHLAFEVSTLTAIPGERPTAPPRLRLDFAWIWLKAWRTARFFLFLALVSPIAWLALLVPHAGSALYVTIQGVWAAYWGCVFAIANTFVAWEPAPPGARPPWFIRVLSYPGTLPVVGLPFRLYGRLLTFATRHVWPACLAFEEATWESAGMALSRAAASIPFVYVVMRPFFGPAATLALLGRRRELYARLAQSTASMPGVTGENATNATNATNEKGHDPRESRAPSVESATGGAEEDAPGGDLLSDQPGTSEPGSAAR